MPSNSRNTLQTNAVVLGGAMTSLAIVQCLSLAGVHPFVVSFGKSDITKYSRKCCRTRAMSNSSDDEAVLRWLEEFSRSVHGEPLLIPCSDRFALFLSRYRDRLKGNFKVWNNEIGDLTTLVEKTLLYKKAKSVGLPVPEGIYEPTDAELRAWLADNAPPYFVKPAYLGVPNASLKTKNRVFDDREGLKDFVRSEGARSLVVQRMIASGDGNVYDVYGLNDSNGKPVVMETHRRIRQWPTDRGITSYGEIPVTNDESIASAIIDMTQQLFVACKYHGIYGVEWIHDPKTDELYLIDVNARPFSSIAHLADSGINLPYLALREIDDDLDRLAPPGSTKHTFWIHVSRDSFSAAAHIWSNKDLTITRWFAQIAKARSFAFWRMNDAVPFLVANYRFFRKVGSMIRRRILIRKDSA